MKNSIFCLIALLLIVYGCSIFEADHKINVTADKRIAGINETIRFSSLNPTPNQIFWTFEDNKTQHGNQVTYRFSIPGTYWVKASLKENGMNYKELKIIITGEVVAEGTAINIRSPLATSDDKLVDYQINLSSNEIGLNEYVTIFTNAENDFEWNLGNGKISREKRLQVNYQQPGQKIIKLIRKSTGQVVNTAFITVTAAENVPEYQDASGEEASGKPVEIYNRNFSTLESLSTALNRLANVGMSSPDKKQIQKQIIADCLDGKKTTVEGTDMTMDDYLWSLIIKTSQYNKVQTSITWEIDSISNKIKKIIINQ